MGHDPFPISTTRNIPATAARRGLDPLEWAILATASALVLAASYLKWWPVAVVEAWGFATGGVCVWLVVREHVWNWPVGIANNLFFFVLFLRARLYADMSLQLVFLAIAVFGWRNWVVGGENRTTLRITHATKREAWGLAIAIVACTLGLREILIAVNDAAPLWDSLTTVLSLAAQYLLSRKRIENWWLWIAADVIYVPLYLVRHLPLTAALYAVFLVLCVAGVRAWRRTPAPAGRVS